MKIVTTRREEFGPARSFKAMLENSILAVSEQEVGFRGRNNNGLYSDADPMLF